MTVKDLIARLLDEPMYAEVKLHIAEEHGTASGYVFDIDNIEHWGARCLITFTDWRAEQTEPNSSENPNNCEHITEDGVTCAKYPACDDCLDNPLNKVKGSERLLKSSDARKFLGYDCETCKHRDEEWDSKACDGCCENNDHYEPMTDCAWK